MNKVVIGLAAIALCWQREPFGSAVSAAYAADLPNKTETRFASPPSTPNWTGCYIGGNVGAIWSNYNISPVNVFGLVIPQSTGTGRGTAGGGQFGCDYQATSNWVVGMRGMWDATNVQGTGGGAGQVPVVPPALAFSTTAGKITDFGTAVARIGYAWSPALIAYAVGGVAFAENHYLQTFAAGAPATPVTFSGSDAPTGWSAGAGVSWMLAPNWDVWLEYDYLGFGKRTVATAFPGASSRQPTSRNMFRQFWLALISGSPT